MPKKNKRNLTLKGPDAKRQHRNLVREEILRELVLARESEERVLEAWARGPLSKGKGPGAPEDWEFTQLNKNTEGQALGSKGDVDTKAL